MTYATQCLGYIAPWYNLVLVGIVIILFIIFLKKPNKKIYILPWRVLLLAIGIYVIEELFTALKVSEIMNIYKIMHPLLEMAIISLFIYMLLLQREYLKKLK